MVFQMMQIPLKCSQCGSQKNHVKRSYPAPQTCVSTTICDDCKHEKVTDIVHTTVTPYIGQQYVEQVKQVETF